MSVKSDIEVAIDAMTEILRSSQSERNKLRAAELLVELKKLKESDRWLPG